MNTSLYRSIGKGFCGSVWALEYASTAIKREDGGPGRSVTNDYSMHLLVLQNASHYLSPSTPLAIPQCHALVQPTDAWWQDRLHQFPAGCSACRAIISERIPKVPRHISDKIVDLFCADNARLSYFVKNNADDDSCLIRPYLGRRFRHNQTQSTSQFRRFSLRNVPLHVDQMEWRPLAWMLRPTERPWQKLLQSRIGVPKSTQTTLNSCWLPQGPNRQPHSLWILDFDCCRPLSINETGVERACAAFYNNDPFYPRPGGEGAADKELWNVFRQTFLIISRVILGYKGGDIILADKLTESIEEEGKLRMRRKEELARKE
ncbi:hypothetical protein P171DRAFT_462832 [Karstenula rhodostoma CBS 690.94]|uniref:DUF3669 domain-containing protein n=1 Tax=Karstenula rhodostoma CBS 690.94 TaxID=1392251 RepID=A0A9P4PK67_9PLEO|nr:hypothetical protein P171DRAFT_462832 [Karstenula rhodostoma CBS 690.94]